MLILSRNRVYPSNVGNLKFISRQISVKNIRERDAGIKLLFYEPSPPVTARINVVLLNLTKYETGLSRIKREDFFFHF